MPCPPGVPKIGFLQEMIEKCSELDNYSVFQMALCMTCLIVLIVRRLRSTKMTVKNANYASTAQTHCRDTSWAFLECFSSP